MALLTGRQLKEVREGKAAEGEDAPKLPEPPVPHAYRVRMHHPDTTVRFPMRDFSMEVEGEEVGVRGGVAIVNPDQEAALLTMGWRRGKQLPLEGEEDVQRSQGRR